MLCYNQNSFPTDVFDFLFYVYTKFINKFEILILFLTSCKQISIKSNNVINVINFISVSGTFGCNYKIKQINRI